MGAVEEEQVTIEDGVRVVQAPGGYKNDTKSMMAGLLGSAPSDLTPEQIEENKRLVEERLAREAAESAQYLSGERSLGKQFPTDAEIEVVGSGQEELPEHEREQIAAAAEQFEEIVQRDGMEIPIDRPDAGYPEGGK